MLNINYKLGKSITKNAKDWWKFSLKQRNKYMNIYKIMMQLKSVNNLQEKMIAFLKKEWN